MVSKTYNYILYIVLSVAAISTMVNAPGILYGYGLVYIVALYAITRYRPVEALVLFGLSHLLSLPILLGTKAIFEIVAFASLLLRTPLVYVISRLRVSKNLGYLSTASILAILDTVIALSIALLYYGDDGIHVGLTPYEFILAIYAYPLIMSRTSRGDRSRAIVVVSSVLVVVGYIASVYAFLSLPLLLASTISLVLLVLSSRKEATRQYTAIVAIVIILIGLFLGGKPLEYNLEVISYPFKPSSWTSYRWAQLQQGIECPPTSNVFNETHSPPRLRIINTCRVVEGVVVGAPRIVNDGDFVFDIHPSEEHRDTLSLGSIILRRNRLHIEVVPADHFEVLEPVGGGVCPGDRVEIVGVFVVDTDHGMWSEIHPVNRIIVIEKNSTLQWPDCIRGIMIED